MSNAYSQSIEAIKSRVENEMFGVTTVIHLALIALCTKGHVLLEGNPGLGKTELVKVLSTNLGLNFGRIQFTPDLMPSDITGTELPPRDGSSTGWQFEQGPIFKSLLLADEINRATPKTQAAMLEAMAEKQVTVLGNTYLVPEGTQVNPDERGSKSKREPFMVLATQNPVDQEGTYPLPEAQADRFMFKILMPTPNDKDLGEILRKMTRNIASNGVGASAPAPMRLDFDQYQDAIKGEAAIPKYTEQHISNIYFATNKRIDLVRNVSKKNRDHLVTMSQFIKFGIGPRGAAALTLGAKGWALLVEGRAEASHISLASVSLPVLRHRIKLEYGWKSMVDAFYDPRMIAGFELLDEDRQRDLAIRAIAEACAPETKGYDRDYTTMLNELIDLQNPAWV